VLDEGGNVEGLHAGDLADAAGGAPFRETAGRVQVRLPGVVVVDLGGEEFQSSRSWSMWRLPLRMRYPVSANARRPETGTARPWSAAVPV